MKNFEFYGVVFLVELFWTDNTDDVPYFTSEELFYTEELANEFAELLHNDQKKFEFDDHKCHVRVRQMVIQDRIHDYIRSRYS